MKTSTSLLTVSMFRVVIIEDIPEDINEIRRLLLQGSDRRYQFIEAETGAAGLLAVFDTTDGPPDCVVLDYTLPDMDAMDVLAGMVGADGLAVCPVVVLTGTAGPRLAPVVLRAGAQDFIGKSWMSAESLTRAVENAVERWAMTRELQARTAALQASETQLHLAVVVAGLGVNRIDYNAGTVVLDPIAAALFGLEAAVPLPRSVIHATFHPADTEEIFRRINQSLDPTGEGTFSMEHRVVHPDGSIRWLSVKKQVTFGDAAGVRRPVTGVLAAVDVTARKLTEERLRVVNEAFRHLVDNSPFGIYAVDSDFRLVQVSAGAQNVFENVRPLIGRDFAEVMRSVWTEPFASEVIAIFRHTLETGIPCHAPSTPEKRQDIAAVESYDWRVERLTLADGRPGVVCHFYDLSERQRYEATLRDEEQRRQLATEVSAVGIWEWNLLTNAIRWDAQMFRLYGIAPNVDGYVQYGDWSGAVLPEELAENERILQDNMRHGRQVRRAFRIRRRGDGQIRDIESAEMTRVNDAGQAEWMIGTNLDVTDRNLADAKLRLIAAELSESDRRKSEFLAMLAHELRNPLAPIRNMLQVLKLKGDDPNAVANASAIIGRQVGQMVRLVDDLLDVSRVSRGRIELRKERVGLASIIRQAEEAANPMCDSMSHELTVTLPSRPVEVNGDPVRLIQVVSNLLTNACKFTDHGGKIWLSVERVADQAVIRVRDNGVGISAGNLPRLFQIFMQVDATLDRSSAGLGIGLALVKNLVEMHDGTVEANSEGIGRGSEFVVRLPALPAEPQARPVGPALTKPTNSATDRTPSLRILVVDDNRDSANSMATLLKYDGHTTHIAYDGLEAVEAATTFRPDVVLLDIGLPGLNGHEACRRIRKLPSDKTIRLIALTGWGQNEDRQKTTEAGFDAHLVKPVEYAELLKLLSK